MTPPPSPRPSQSDVSQLGAQFEAHRDFNHVTLYSADEGDFTLDLDLEKQLASEHENCEAKYVEKGKAGAPDQKYDTASSMLDHDEKVALSKAGLV